LNDVITPSAPPNPSGGFPTGTTFVQTT
jgi:hypothetical protein